MRRFPIKTSHPISAKEALDEKRVRCKKGNSHRRYDDSRDQA